MLKIIVLVTTLLLSSAQAFAVCTAPQWAVDPGQGSLVQYNTFFSAAIGANTSYAIYLPPAYTANPTARFPVLYWLHGGGSNLHSGEDFVTRLDDAIARGVTPPFIVVLSNGPETMWTDSNPGKTPYDAPIETVIMNELIPLIDSTYRTIATREGRGVEGFSMGGRGSSRLGLRYPDQFGLVSDLAGAVQGLATFQIKDGGEIYTCVYGDDANYFDATSPQTHATDNAPFIQTVPFLFRIVVGELDSGNLKANLDFSALLTSLSIEHSFTTIPGVGHSYQNLYDLGGDSMFTFFADAWEDTGGGGSEDTTPPSTPQGLHATAIGASRVTLSWTASTDNLGVAGYKIFRNGVQINTSTTPTYSERGLNAHTLYLYSVSAVDAAGNESKRSAVARVTTER